MRRLLWLTLALAALYGGYWVVASRAVLRGVEAALAQMKADGVADYADVSLIGFPSRFDVTIDRPSLVSRNGGIGWNAPFLQIFALSYRPNHIIAVWPHDQTLTLGRQTVAVRSDDLRASAVFGGGAAVALDHAQAVGKALAFASDAGWGLAAAEARAAIRIRDRDANRYDIATDLAGLSPDGWLVDVTAPLAGDGDTTGWIHLEATAAFDRPLDRHLAEAPARLARIEVTGAQVTFGRFDLSGAGGFDIGVDGLAEGRLDLRLAGWQGLPDTLVGLGLLTPEVAPTLTQALTVLAQGQPDGAVELPFVIAGGLMSLGPVPLGPAPRF